MFDLLQWLFRGHVHKWKTIKEVKLVDYDDMSKPIGTRYHQQCEHCGKVVKRDMN